jgi:RNA recognition motif-containing protein
MELLDSDQILLATALIEALLTSEASQVFWEASVQSSDACKPADQLTTLMVRNIPKKLTQKQFMSEPDFAVFLNSIDFLYLPTDISSGRNLGYAFINFQTPDHASLFKNYFHKKLNFFGNKTGLTVSYAAIQGLEANVANIAHNASVHRIRNPDYLPLIRCGPAAQHTQGDLLAWRRY